MELLDHQVKAVDNLGNGKVLYGGVGSGKSITVMAYYANNEAPADVIVITTAKKRDTLDWESAAIKFGISTERELSRGGLLTVDSWNNIGKYTDVEGAFFVFDEQRLVGSGPWVKSFLKIAQKNRWVVLSATPGDTWLDYAPIFIANGYYKNITEFRLRHVVYEPFTNFPKVRHYLDRRHLERLRNEVLVEMPYASKNRPHVNWMDVGFDQEKLMTAWGKRWHVYEDRPIVDISELFRVMRKIVNTDPSRLEMLRLLMKSHDRMLVFYSFNYELELLRSLADEIEVGELNGHKKDSLPTGEKWLYLVQYVSGAEGWNCTATNATVFYSLTYSYKTLEQSMGRTDRLDTPYDDLYYYIFVTNSVPDMAIRKSLEKKRTFNERKFVANLQRRMT